MENNTNLMNTEDYGLSFSDELNDKIQTVFSDNEGDDIRSFAANVIIGNIPAKKINENIGDVFGLSGCYVKEIQFKESSKKGRYLILFGRNSEGLCAYSSTSEKVYEALAAIISAYGKPSAWRKPINVRTQMYYIDDNGGKSYSLEVLG